jgi:hypothetical protein
MTEEILVTIIMQLCTKTNDAGIPTPDKVNNAASCMEPLVNCAVGTNGKIMTLKDFTNKCVKSPIVKVYPVK